ncbi:MAG TPA: FtsX-like permease family protein [Blastocatellia bacterium]
MLASSVFGLVPALQGSKPNLNESLSEGGRSGIVGRRGRRVRNALAIAEVALALVLLIGTGLMIKSFRRIQQADMGFRLEGVLTMRVMLPQRNYPDNNKRNEFFKNALEQVRTVPGVEAAGAVSQLPLSGSMLGSNFEAKGRSAGRSGDPFSADLRGVTPDYFKTMRIDFIDGRDFNDMDKADGPAVAIIDEKLAKRFWPDQSPVGQRIRWTRVNQWLQIVGVVKSIRHYGPNEPVVETVYRPITQYPQWQSYLVVRTAGEPLAAVNAVRGRLWSSLDPNLPISEAQAMQTYFRDSIGQPRFNAYLFSVFAGIALLLAVIGVYGVISYSVTERTQEIGVRLAMGANKGDVLRLIIGGAARLVATGVAIGLLAAFFLTQLLSKLLFEVSRTDPITYILISIILAVAALIACYIPARRAMKVDPMIALRHG